MAVHTVRVDTNIQAPFNTYQSTNGCAIGADIYLCTYNGLYKFDTVSEVYTTILTFSTIGGMIDKSPMIHVDGILYMLTAGYSSAYGYWYKVYKIDLSNPSLVMDREYRTGWAGTGTKTTHPFMNINNKFVFIFSYVSASMYMIGELDPVAHTINTRSISDVRPMAQQITDGYIFGTEGSTLKQKYVYRITSYNTNPTLLTTASTEFVSGDPTFEYDNKIYLLSTSNSRIFNPSSNTFESFDVTITSRVMCNQVGDDYYLLSSTEMTKISFVTYNLTYDIKNGDGSETMAEITGAAPITTLRFTISGNFVGYAMTTINGIRTGNYSTTVPEGYQLTGYARVPNSDHIDYPLNTDISVSIGTDFTFYEVYSVYRPPETTFDVDLYKNTAEPNRVDKTSFLTAIGTLSGALRDECSVINPSIVIYYDHVPDFNYVYIQIFGRYYFVRGITSVRKNLWRIDLDCDVLMTYKSGILALSAVIGRQEFDYNADLVDSDLPVEKEVSVTVDEISSTAFSTEATGTNVYNYVLTVIGS